MHYVTASLHQSEALISAESSTERYPITLNTDAKISNLGLENELEIQINKQRRCKLADDDEHVHIYFSSKPGHSHQKKSKHPGPRCLSTSHIQASADVKQG